MNDLLNFYNDHEKQVILVFGLVVGLVVGLFLAWVVWPTQFRNATPYMLRENDFRDDYLSWVAEEYAATGDLEQAQRSLGMDVSGRGRWREDPVTVLKALAEARGGEDGARLQALAQDLEAAPAEEQPSLREKLVAVFWVLLIIVLAVVVGAGGYFGLRWLRVGRVEPLERAVASLHVEPVAWEAEGAVPLTQFVTAYTLGDDFYDPSFSIEKANGDFLGECGVGISEDIGVGDPKKITAMEVWLFDKNDIRTVTKVLMSDYAFHDEALRTSLASKGDLIPVEKGAEIVLETATLVLRARLLELEYGEGQLPTASFFKRVKMEIGAWVKPGAEETTTADFSDLPAM